MDKGGCRDAETLQEVNYLTSETKYDQKLKPEYHIRKADPLFLYFAVMTPQLLAMVYGATIVWLSPVLVKLRSNDTEINPLSRPITTAEVSALAGSPALFGLIGVLLLPSVSDFVGRKRFLQVLGLLMTISGVAIAFSRRVMFMVISKIVFGTFLQAAVTVTPIYIAEICEDHNRAKFGCFFGVFIQIGHFFAFLIGPLLSVRDFTLIITLPSFFFLVIAFFFPESPFYLLAKGKEDECKKALRKFRNNISDVDLQLELVKMKQTFQAKINAKKGNVLSLFKSRENRIAMGLALLPLLVQHLAGIAVIMQFLAPLFNSAGTTLSGNNVAVLVSVVKIFCFSFTTFIVQKFGRRKLLLVSVTGTGFPLVVLGFYFYLKYISSSYIVYLQWLPLTALLTSIVAYSMGLGPIPPPLVSEWFPSDIRAVGSGFVCTIMALSIFVQITSFPFISQAFGIHCCLWLFSMFCFVGAVLIYAYLPETKGKSFSEIQEILKNY